MSERKWPATKLGTAWLTYAPEDGWTEFDNPADAEECFSRIVEHLRDESKECWHESADCAAWGVWIPIERLRLVATAWSDDDTEAGERCREAGWDAFLDGVVDRVESDDAAREFCAGVADAAARDEIARLTAEVERLRRVLAVEQGNKFHAPKGWERINQTGWSGPRHTYIHRQHPTGWEWAVPMCDRRGHAPTALEAMEAADRAALEVSDV